MPDTPQSSFSNLAIADGFLKSASTINARGRAGFVPANDAKYAHSCSMKITGDVRKYAAGLGLAEGEDLKKGMDAKAKEFVEKGAEVYAKA